MAYVVCCRVDAERGREGANPRDEGKEEAREDDMFSKQFKENLDLAIWVPAFTHQCPPEQRDVERDTIPSGL